jgi:hypothetical protein
VEFAFGTPVVFWVSWHDAFGETMIVTGFVGIISIYIRALRRDPG